MNDNIVKNSYKGGSTMAYRMDIFGATGIGMRAILVLKDEKCPNHNNHAEKDMVEFYDLRHDHTPDGQFIAAFFLDDLNEIKHSGKGLVFEGGIREWQINDRVKGMVLDWAGYILYKTLEKIECLPKFKDSRLDPRYLERLKKEALQ